MRPLRTILTGAVAIALFSATADAQRCSNGKPCGNTCIARSKTCRVGRGTAAYAPGAEQAAEVQQAVDGSSEANLRPAFAYCFVDRVIDGDTFDCAGGRRVRLLLIDAPERDQEPFGERSRRKLIELLPVEVRLYYDVERTDAHGRTLAYAMLPDGRMVNEEMIRAGYAVVSVHPPNVQHLDRMRAASDEAERAKRGLWSGSAFNCLPADHRARRC